jgi:hypothetical protein
MSAMMEEQSAEETSSKSVDPKLGVVRRPSFLRLGV